MKMYLYKNCGSCQKAKKWLDARGVDFEAIAIRETPPSVAELKQMLDYQGGHLRALFNTAGGDYRELKLKDKLQGMDEVEALELLSSRGNLVKRPFVLGADFGLLGFDAERWADRISG